MVAEDGPENDRINLIFYIMQSVYIVIIDIHALYEMKSGIKKLYVLYIASMMRNI